MEAPVIVGDAERRMSARGGVRDLPVHFDGDAREYFGIWIVNILLSIVTVGIWSAWAKVRTERYFYGNTAIDGHAFEYHATGYQIFKGRLIAFIVFMALAAASQFAPLVYAGLWVALILVMPWVINRSLRFNARVTSWRNVRFDFSGTYGRAFVVFVLMPAASFVTLGLLLPVWSRMRARYVVGGHSYGGVPFTTDPRLGPLYGALGGAVLFAGTLVVSLMGLSTIVALGVQFTFERGSAAQAMAGLLPLLGLLLIGIAALFYRARVQNETIGRMRLAEQGFHCDLSGLRYAWIVASGIVATIVTLGLLRPWAEVRRWRYVASAIGVLAVGDLDGFVADRVEAGSSFATEFGEMEGFDVGF
jgi:uncharacterized membrane protein YjgN (DUF898 family)